MYMLATQLSGVERLKEKEVSQIRSSQTLFKGISDVRCRLGAGDAF